MARGGFQAPAKFFSGAVVLQPVEQLDRFVRTAATGSEFVYCDAAEPMHGETFARARALDESGVVRIHQRRRDGGGWQWVMVRTGKALPKQQSPQDKVLGDRATMAIFIALKRAANFRNACPSDAELARLSGLNTRDQAKWRMRELTRVGLIVSEQVYDGGVPSRVVTIAEGRHAGSAGGKFTALPKKWAALQQAAQRDAVGTGGGR